MAAPSVVVQKYKCLRTVEVALCGTLHDMVTDAALNFAARTYASAREQGYRHLLRERGDARSVIRDPTAKVTRRACSQS